MGMEANRMLIEYINKMKQTKKGRQTLAFLGATLAVVVILVVLIETGVFAKRSGVRIGSVEQVTKSTWKETHYSFDGTMEKTLKSKDSTLNVEIETTKGALDVTIKDKAGNVLYEGVDVGNATFTVETEGFANVNVKGTRHEGSFRFTY